MTTGTEETRVDGEEVKKRGLFAAQLDWKKLDNAKTAADVAEICASVLSRAKETGVHVSIAMPAEEYVQMMQLAFIAKAHGEIVETTPLNYIDRALQVMYLHLKTLAVRHRT